MFDVLNQAMLHMLDVLRTFTGSYGMAIVALTVLIRVALWPLNSAQTRSMKKMQELQPKLKALQERHKDNPQKLQEAMMKFYAENKFNPFAGCMPMLLQLPIFIALYGALNSPDFLVRAGEESFLFVGKLYHTLRGSEGHPLDGQFTVMPDAKFETGKTITLHLKSGKTLERHIDHPQKALTIRPQPLIPGDPVFMSLSMKGLGLSEDFNQLIETADVPVINMQSRELETLHLKPRGPWLTESIKTVEGKPTFHKDVLILVILYGLMTLLYQKVMQKQMTPSDDPQQAMQAKMMQWMPLMFIGFLLFVPIPAGVMIYLVVTTALMFLQTVWVHYRDTQKAAKTPTPPSAQVVDISAAK